MNEYEKIIESFYQSFVKKDWRGMQQHYHQKIAFSDPVFQNLQGDKARAMWHMLAEAAKDLTIQFKNVKSDGKTGSCDWEAFYSFSKTGRKVHNIIHAEFEFAEGKILKHTDTFDLWKWSGMALGFSGKLLGWSSFIQSKIRAGAQTSLDRFLAAHPEYKS